MEPDSFQKVTQQLASAAAFGRERLPKRT